MKQRFVIGGLAIAGLLAAGIIAGIAVAIHSCEISEARTRQYNKMAKVAMLAMCEGVAMSSQGVSLPKGDVRDLYRWMTSSRYIMRYEWPYGPRADISDTEVGTFRDSWGHELVYRFPPRRKDILFELYSVGPNGIDEDGQGDDITTAKVVAFENHAVKSLFKDGIVDPKWFWQNLERLERDPKTACIIGAPPEQFRNPNATERDRE